MTRLQKRKLHLTMLQIQDHFTGLPVSLYERLSGLPARSRNLLSQPPTRGAGHREIFRDACFLLRNGFVAEETEQVIQARFSNYYRRVDEREIAEAVRNASGAAAHGAPRWPDRNDVLVASTLLPEVNVKVLQKSSPVSNPSSIPTGSILDRFFKNEDLVCFSDFTRHASTNPRGYFKGREHDYSLIVPNAMSAQFGKTRDGRPSQRCLENSGPSRIQVVEFDTGSLDEQASLLLAIAACGVSLRMVVFSGSKSLHGWFDVAGLALDRLTAFRRYAAALGADPSTFSSCQLVRNPNARREVTGAIQTVYYLS